MFSLILNHYYSIIMFYICILINSFVIFSLRVGESVSFSCVTKRCDSGSYIRWYQKKEGETFRIILYIDWSGGRVSHYNHPQKNDFSALRTHSGCDLKIENVKLDHSATYYCKCWKTDSHSEK
uniref:Ig-like domain-containing protein n=1 Tax=Oreochromis aureus TaxID=47969 RepID=A0AAZ1XJ47_OREAU